MTTFWALRRKKTGTVEPTLYKRIEAAQAKADQNGLYEVFGLSATPLCQRPETDMEHMARDMRDGIFPSRSERRIIPAPTTPPAAQSEGGDA